MDRQQRRKSVKKPKLKPRRRQKKRKRYLVNDVTLLVYTKINKIHTKPRVTQLKFSARATPDMTQIFF